MTPVDFFIAGAGRLASAIDGPLGRRRRLTWAIAAGLITLSSVVVLVIGSSPRPTDLTFEDVRLDRIPAMTSWVRLEGELRAGNSGLFELHDTRDDSLYIIVHDAESLPLGHLIVTGRISPAATTGNIGTLVPDLPPVPKANEPFAVILLPVALGSFLVLGIRRGYPVVRRERRGRGPTGSLGPGESMPIRWSGRIVSDIVPRGDAHPGTIAVASAPDVSDLSIDEGGLPRRVRVRRPAPVRRVRTCRLGGCEPGLEVYAPAAELLLTFTDRASRDQFEATLR